MADSSHTAALSCAPTEFKTTAFNPAESRRTRKRINAAQLVHLEELYQRSSHPSRDERDALARRVQMYWETKSVTIWFQNKRQTDRRVALRNATNSRNLTHVDVASRPNHDISLTSATSAARPPASCGHRMANHRASSQKNTRRPLATRNAPLKRSLSLASSVMPTSTNHTPKSCISLDNVASRSEIRFTDRRPLPRNGYDSTSFRRTFSTPSLTLTSGSSAPLSLPRAASDKFQVIPASPPPPASTSLWETMLSSPPAPSSPPPAEYIAYMRSRKARTLDWACAAALPIPEPILAPHPKCSSPIQPEVSFSKTDAQDSATQTTREYEDATSMTEDEDEIITPQSSQNTSSPLLGQSKISGPKFDWTLPLHNVKKIPCAMEEVDTGDCIRLSSHGWQEDEMHAALALCGLRG